MGVKEQPAFCSLCGEELITNKEIVDFDSSSTRVTLRCPKKRWSDTSLLAIFYRDRHTEKFVEYTDTVLNYDPFTGERIRR